MIKQNYVHLLFTRDDSITSKGIRLLTKSDWSHVDIIMEEYFAVGAIAPSGITVRDIDDVIESSTAHQIISIPVDIDAWSFLSSQLRKPYDWMGLIGIVFPNRDWQEDDKWFCSELAGAFLVASNVKTPWDNVHRVTPGMLFDFVTTL